MCASPCLTCLSVSLPRQQLSAPQAVFKVFWGKSATTTHRWVDVGGWKETTASLNLSHTNHNLIFLFLIFLLDDVHNAAVVSVSELPCFSAGQSVWMLECSPGPPQSPFSCFLPPAHTEAEGSVNGDLFKAELGQSGLNLRSTSPAPWIPGIQQHAGWVWMCVLGGGVNTTLVSHGWASLHRHWPAGAAASWRVGGEPG